jgi:ribosomal protein L22
MVDCKPILMLMDTQAKVSAKSRSDVADLTQYKSLDGALQYLTFTRPDIVYAV